MLVFFIEIGIFFDKKLDNFHFFCKLKINSFLTITNNNNL